MYASSCKNHLLFAVALVACGHVGPAIAGSDSGVLGDWGGLRTRLADKGVDVKAQYESDTAWNPGGGRHQGARYADQWLLAATFDLGKLANVDGAKFYVGLTRRDGHSLSKDVIGNEVPVQQIYGAGEDFRLSDLWYQQTFGDGHWEARLGRVHVSDDFAHASCTFQNLGFCAAPYALLANSGWAQFPLGVWGARIKFMSGPWYVETGVYQVNPTYKRSSDGFKLDLSGTTGVLVPAEVGVQPKLGSQQLPGDYKIGAYYDSSDTSDVYQDVHGQPAALTGLPPRERNGRYGGYVMALQQVTARAGDSSQGLSVFAEATLADRNTALIRDSLTLGLRYKGPFRSRADDEAELAVGRYKFNGRLAAYQRQLDFQGAGPVGVQDAETDIALQYNAQVAKWCALGPNLQYVIHPNGLRSIDNAFVAGLQAKVTF